MSVILRGIRKIQNCENTRERCPLLDGDDNCKLQGTKYKTWEEQYANCPLDEILEKHGKLVEFIDIVTMYDEYTGTQEVNLADVVEAYFKMREAPAILEAEE